MLKLLSFMMSLNNESHLILVRFFALLDKWRVFATMEKMNTQSLKIKNMNRANSINFYGAFYNHWTT